MRRLLVMVLLAGCEGRLIGTGGAGGGAAAGGGGGSGGGDVYVDPPDAGDLSNFDVYSRLKPTCQGCHTMDMRPFFASLDAFENLIVYDTRYVVPQDLGGSVLLGLLRSTVGRQMPPLPNDRFETLEGKGLTHITLAELEEWIRRLPPRGGQTPVDPPLVRRKTAEQVQAAL